jgi:hypothetical protein
MNEEDVIAALTDAINERLAEINFYRGEGNGLTKYEMRDRAQGWLKEALFPSTPRVKDKPAKGAK